MSKKLPSDPEGINDDRAEWAASALRRFQRVTGTDNDDAPADLICDLMHWCDRHEHDFDQALSLARMHYEAETSDDPADLLEALEAQTDAAQRVVDAWEKGD